jgi:CDP-diacylglycerol--glycerol-3-phosphate 3-phosphatidyltransferase
MKNKIPHVLIFSRLALGFLVLAMSYNQVPHYNIWAITLLTVGLLTDIFDGIIARQLQISTVGLRRLDSTIDQIFFISFAVATYLQCPAFFKANYTMLLVVFGLEALTYLVSFAKFKREVATHSIAAKIWSLIIFATLIEIILHCNSTLLFSLFNWVGIGSRLEIIAILIVLKEWTNDVPTVYHSYKLRKGIPIKRHKLFNG